MELFEACFGHGDGAGVLAWRYDRCPHGVPVCLLGSLDGQAISGYACNPRRLGWDEAGQVVGQTGDVMTLPEARGAGYFSRLDRRAMELVHGRDWPVVFGLPNRQSARIFMERLGWKGVGQLQPWTLVLRSGPVARRERLRAGRLASWLSPLAARRAQRVLARLANQARSFVVEPVERFDRWVEPIGRAVAERYVWMVRRDADYLNWRFFEGPNSRFSALRVLDRAGEPVGYGVVQRPVDAADGVGYLVDLVATSEDAQGAVLAAAVEQLAARGARVVRAHAITGSDWQAFLRNHAFQPPKPEDAKWVIAYVHQSEHPLAQAALDPTRWFFTDADRDDELVR